MYSLHQVPQVLLGLQRLLNEVYGEHFPRAHTPGQDGDAPAAVLPILVSEVNVPSSPRRPVSAKVWSQIKLLIPSAN